MLPAETREYVGRVVYQRVCIGTDMEHDAVALEIDRGTFTLMRPEIGPDFIDPLFEVLVGKTIRCTGRIELGRLFLVDWRVIEPGAEPPSL